MIFARKPSPSAAPREPIAIPLDHATVLRIVDLFRTAEQAMNEGRPHLQSSVDYTGLVTTLHERVGAAIAHGGDDAPVPLLIDTEFRAIEHAIESLRCDGTKYVSGAFAAARAGRVLLDELHLRRGYAVATLAAGEHRIHVFPPRLTSR